MKYACERCNKIIKHSEANKIIIDRKSVYENIIYTNNDEFCLCKECLEKLCEFIKEQDDGK